MPGTPILRVFSRFGPTVGQQRQEGSLEGSAVIVFFCSTWLPDYLAAIYAYAENLHRRAKKTVFLSSCVLDQS